MAITEPSLAFSAALILLAYLIGSVPFAVVVSKLMGLQDPRSYGSKNPGATNVLRTGKTAAAVLTLAGDAGKGWLAVWLASLITTQLALAGVPQRMAMLCTSGASLRAAVEGGFAIAPMPVSQLTPGLIALSVEHGLPLLPEAEFMLMTSPTGDQAVLSALADRIVEHLCPTPVAEPA